MPKKRTQNPDLVAPPWEACVVCSPGPLPPHIPVGCFLCLLSLLGLAVSFHPKEGRALNIHSGPTKHPWSTLGGRQLMEMAYVQEGRASSGIKTPGGWVSCWSWPSLSPVKGGIREGPGPPPEVHIVTSSSCFILSAWPYMAPGPSSKTPRGPTTCSGDASVSPALELPAPRKVISLETKAESPSCQLCTHMRAPPPYAPESTLTAVFTKGLMSMASPQLCHASPGRGARCSLSGGLEMLTEGQQQRRNH